MLVAARVPVTVGIVQWPGCGTVTLIIKRSFDLALRGIATPCDVQEPLALDRFDPSGAFLFPSDFAPRKSMCDVAIVGRALLDPVGPVRVRVGSFEKVASRPALLAPRPGGSPFGDLPDLMETNEWTSASFAVDSFQSAPADQQMPWPVLPFELTAQVGRSFFEMQVVSAPPEALLLDESGWIAPQAVDLYIDGVLIDPARRRFDLVWRGVIDVPPQIAALLVVELARPLRSWKVREMLAWPRSEAVGPPDDVAQPHEAVLGRAGSSRPSPALDDFGDDDTTGAATGKIVLPSFDDEETSGFEPLEGTVSLDADDTSSSSIALPFATKATPFVSEHTVDDEDALAGTVTLGQTSAARGLPFTTPAPALVAEVTTEERTSDPLETTVSVEHAATRSALPFRDGSVASPRPRTRIFESDPHLGTGTVDLAPREIAAIRREMHEPGVAAAPREKPPTIVLPASSGEPGAVELVRGLTAAQFAVVKSELSGGARRRGETLEKHGLTELRWRLAERRLAAHLASRPEDAREISRELSRAQKDAAAPAPPRSAQR